MSLLLYMDVHVPWSVTVALRRSGVDILTAQDDESTLLDDPRLLDRATTLGRILVTQDEDFLMEGARRQRTGVHFLGIIYAHQTRLTVGKFIQDLEVIAKVSEPEELRSQVVHLPLR